VISVLDVLWPAVGFAPTAAREEPVTLAQAKAQCRVDHDADNDYLDGLIRAAVDLTEAEAGRRWMARDETVRLSAFPARPDPDLGLPVVRLPVRPVSAVTAVRYRDSTGTLATLAADGWQDWLDHEPPLLAPAPGASWPATQAGRLRAVEVDVTSGYGDAADVPELAKRAILLAVGYWYENRGDAEDPHQLAASFGLPPGAERLLGLLRQREYR